MTKPLRIKHRKIGELEPDPNNARMHSDEQVQQISESIEEFGFNNPILTHGNKIVAGHGRHMAAILLGLEKVPTIALDHLSEEQRRMYVLADNKIAENAHWNDTLLSAEIESLLDLPDIDIGLTGFSADEIENLLGGDTEKERQTYSRRIVAPVYEPSGDEPDPTDLYDDAKTEELVTEIDAAKLPPEVAHFLRLAAQRHTVFDFQSIADFYAHADKKTQRLMERSALVIIDFDQAIENGFVRLSEKLLDLAIPEEE